MLSGDFHSYSFRILHHLFHEAAHLLRCLFLHLPSGVGVGTQSEACVIVPQHRGDCFHVYTILQRHGGEGMPQIVEPDVFQPRVLQDLLMKFGDGIRVIHLSRLW